VGVERLEDVAREQRVVDAAVFIFLEAWQFLLANINHDGDGDLGLLGVVVSLVVLESRQLFSKRTRCQVCRHSAGIRARTEGQGGTTAEAR